MITLLSIFATIILGYYIMNFHSYISFLFYNIAVAASPDIKSKLQHTAHTTHTELAIKQHIIWAMIWSPITILTIIQLIVIACEPIIDTPIWIYSIIPFFLASSITPIITFKKPSWITEWYNNNILAEQLVQLEQLTNQLELVKDQLVDICKNPSSVNPQDTMKLHSYAKFLIYMSNELKSKIDLNSSN